MPDQSSLGGAFATATSPPAPVSGEPFEAALDGLQKSIDRLQDESYQPGHAAPRLGEITRDVASVLVVDLGEWTRFLCSADSAKVIDTLNDLFAAVQPVLNRYQAEINRFYGGGFTAVVRGSEHAWRAIAAGFGIHREAAAMGDPTAGSTDWEPRVGVGTGPVSMGYVGTQQRMEYTAIGWPAILANHLQSAARPRTVCVCRSTFQSVKGRVLLHADTPRELSPRHLGTVAVWDVCGCG